MKRPPFKLDVRGRRVDVRVVRDHRITVRNGWADYIWLHSVLTPLAWPGREQPRVWVRLSDAKRSERPWHEITMTRVEAYRALVEFGGGTARGIVKRIDRRVAIARANADAM